MTDWTIELGAKGTDLSGRVLGRELRQQIVTSNCRVHLDFEGVECASESFLDELFGVLVLRKGKSWFREHVKVSNLPHTIRADIAQVVSQRLRAPESTPPPSVHTLA